MKCNGREKLHKRLPRGRKLELGFSKTEPNTRKAGMSGKSIPGGESHVQTLERNRKWCLFGEIEILWYVEHKLHTGRGKKSSLSRIFYAN